MCSGLQFSIAFSHMHVILKKGVQICKKKKRERKEKKEALSLFKGTGE